MATLTDYKGLDVVEDATGDGGIALTDNFKALADRAAYQATANPGAGDDDTQGFAPGDQWLDTSTSVLWACVSNGTGAAVWKSLYKRTATGLELIPEEPSETVLIEANGRLDGKLGVQRTAATALLEVQQESGDSVGGIRVFNNSAAVAAEIQVLTSGTIALKKVGGTSGGRIVIQPGESGTITAWGKTAVGGNVIPTVPLHVAGDVICIDTAKTPPSASAAGSTGDICWDGDYVYVCVAANTWKRAALATW